MFIYLTVEDALNFHRMSLHSFGGGQGVRDASLLESAIEQARQTFGGQPLYATIPEVSASYLHSIVVNHPFVDGNKRTGLFCAAVFLEINGFELSMTDDEAEKMTLEVAKGEFKRPELSELISSHVVPSG
ncbi:type II toxin-antitoxin system death-on-curing family toxin [soil metagenome]